MIQNQLPFLLAVCALASCASRPEQGPSRTGKQAATDTDSDGRASPNDSTETKVEARLAAAGITEATVRVDERGDLAVRVADDDTNLASALFSTRRPRFAVSLVDDETDLAKVLPEKLPEGARLVSEEWRRTGHPQFRDTYVMMQMFFKGDAELRSLFDEALPEQRRLAVGGRFFSRSEEGIAWDTRTIIAYDPFLSEDDVAKVEIFDGRDSGHNGWDLSVTLTPQGREQLATVTRSNLGKRICVELNGVLEMLAMLVVPMEGGKLTLSYSPFDRTDSARFDAIAWAAGMNAGSLPEDVVIEVEPLDK